MTVDIITWWVEVDVDGEMAWVPHVATVYEMDWRDATNQQSESIPPTPNIVVVNATISQATYDAIAADPAYGPGSMT